MITLTRSGAEGSRLTLNSDLIERIEEVPDTVITLVDGKHYRVRESSAEVVEAILAFRSAIIEQAYLPDAATLSRGAGRGHVRLSAVRDDRSVDASTTSLGGPTGTTTGPATTGAAGSQAITSEAI